MHHSPVRLGLIGSGWIGAFHAETIAQRIPGAVLAAVADPQPGAAERVAASFASDPDTRPTTYLDAADLLRDPLIDGVVISSPAFTHADLVVAAANSGKAVFVEKPMALTLDDADRAIAAAADAGVPLRTGFNRRFARDFAAAHRVTTEGNIGTPQLLRSLTRDPGVPHPGTVKPWTIFLETLIHDFDALNWFNAGARPTSVFAVADALAYPDFKEAGLLDTAVVTIRYDNGSIATAEASFSASYGYDVRGEIFGSGGMVTAGDPHATSARVFTSEGESGATHRLNTDLFHQAYTDELVSFAAAVRDWRRGDHSGTDAHSPESDAPYTVEPARGEDARAALVIALACIASFEQGRPVAIAPDGSLS